MISPGPRAPTSFPSVLRKRSLLLDTNEPAADKGILESRTPLCTQGPESSVQPYAGMSQGMNIHKGYLK